MKKVGVYFGVELSSTPERVTCWQISQQAMVTPRSGVRKVGNGSANDGGYGLVMKREVDGKRCTKLSIALDLDPAVVLFHDLLTNSQAEAGAGLA